MGKKLIEFLLQKRRIGLTIMVPGVSIGSARRRKNVGHWSPPVCSITAYTHVDTPYLGDKLLGEKILFITYL